MRHLCLMIVASLSLGFACPALAQDADIAQRTDLARRLIQLGQGPGITKMIEAQVDAQMGEVENLTERERNWMRANMPPMASRMAQRMQDEMVGVYAETYSVAELEGMVAFFDSPLGRDISAKAFDLGIRQGEIMTTIQSEFMTDLMTKYCAAFTCGGASSAGPKGQ